MSDVRLDYAVPEPDLAEYISLFYLFEADVPVFEDTERADRAQLRFRLNPLGAEYRFPDGSVQRAEGIHILGPTTGAMTVRAEGPVRVFYWVEGQFGYALSGAVSREELQRVSQEVYKQLQG